MSNSRTFVGPAVCRFPIFVLVFLASTMTLRAHHVPTPIQLSFGGAGGADPVIAVDSRGDIDVAWIGSSIFFARSTDRGVSFSNPREIAPLMTSAANLQIGLDERNNINLSWTTPTGIFFVRSTNDGESFGTPSRISTAHINTIESLQMVVERKGAIDLTWLLGIGQGTGSLDAFFSRSTDGGTTFSTPVDALSTRPNSFFNGNLQSLTGPKGQIYVFVTSIAERGESHDCSVLFSRSTDHGNTFSSPEDLSSASGRCSTSQATVDSRGDIDVALLYGSFSQIDPAPRDTLLFRRSKDDGASFSGPIKVSGPTQFFNSTDIQFTKHFQIFVGSCEQIYIVWTAGNPGANTLFFARSKDNGDTFTNPEILSGPTNSQSDKDAALAVDAHGDVNVAWSDSGPSDASGPLEILFTRSRDEGKAFQNPKILTASTGLSAVAPRMVLSASGEAFLVWQANSPNHPATMPSQVFFGRVPSSFSQPVDFEIRVSPRIVTVSPGQTVHFRVTGHDLDDARELKLACSLLPASTKNLSSAPVFESTCTFNPPSLSRSDRSAHLPLTIPPMLESGSYSLGVAGVGNSTFNVETVQVNVGE